MIRTINVKTLKSIFTAISTKAKKSRGIIIKIFSFLFSLGLLFIAFNSIEIKTPSLCTSQVNYAVENKSINYRVDANYSIVMESKSTGQIIMLGDFFKNDKSYELNRLYSFNVQALHNDLYKIKITSMEKHDTDDVNDDEFNQNFLPQKIGSTFVVSLSMLNKKIILIKGMGYNYHSCLKK